MKIDEVLKKIVGYIVAFFIGVGTAICYVFLHNRRTVDRLEDGIKGAEESLQSARDSDRLAEQEIDDSRRLAEELGESVSDMSGSIERIEGIIEKIEKQKID